MLGIEEEREREGERERGGERERDKRDTNGRPGHRDGSTTKEKPSHPPLRMEGEERVREDRERRERETHQCHSMSGRRMF